MNTLSLEWSQLRFVNAETENQVFRYPGPTLSPNAPKSLNKCLRIALSVVSYRSICSAPTASLACCIWAVRLLKGIAQSLCSSPSDG